MPKRNVVAEPNQHSIVATCVFNAPRDLVFQVMTDPATMTQWWGPRHLPMTVDCMEPRAGGRWRYVIHDQGGKVWAFHGLYHTVEAPAQVISTYEWEARPGHVSLETTLFEDYEGGTRVTVNTVYQSTADRDERLKSGMDEGEDEAMDRLEELLGTMLAAKRESENSF